MRGMKMGLARGAVLIGALLGLSASAIAQSDPGINPVVVSLPLQVSLARPGTKQADTLVTYAGYRVTYTNTTTNTLNRLYFRAIAVNVGGSDTVQWDSSTLTPDVCTGYDSSSLNCETSIGLLPGASFSFIVVARAPQTGLEIRVDWVAGGHEGNGSGNGCCGIPGSTSTTLIDSRTNTSYLSNVQSYVKDTGGAFFTGDRYITRTADPISTRVFVPGLTVTYDIGSISESENTAPDAVATCSSRAKLAKCYGSTVTVPTVDFSLGGTVTPTQFLEIVLRLDSSAIKNKVKVEEVLVKYDGVEVPMCGLTSPQPYPCIVERKEFINSSDPEFTRDLKGDFQWRIKHFKNGRYDLF